jgi:transporter family-2 protein
VRAQTLLDFTQSWKTRGKIGFQMTNAIFAVIAFAAGAALSVQAAANGQLGIAMGGDTFAAAFYSFLTGTIALALFAILNGRLSASFSVIPSQPWGLLIGGLLGAGAVSATILLAPRIGVANLLALVIAGQLLASLVVDNFGILGITTRPVSLIKIAGSVIMIAGVLLAIFGDQLLKAWNN